VVARTLGEFHQSRHCARPILRSALTIEVTRRKASIAILGRIYLSLPGTSRGAGQKSEIAERIPRSVPRAREGGVWNAP